MLWKRSLRKICEAKAQEVTGGWRKPYNEELNNLHSATNSRL
jgi:hypothetical protein